MDDARARELLAAEREKLETAIASGRAGERQAAAEQDDPGERGTESLYESELGSGLEEDLADRLAALERAERRLAEGTFGRSVLSGEPIPDERLEALPTAELTVDEQRTRDG